ncbi:protein ALP1-like [Trichonephila clavipes]|uniref:Protein ALP1-like n=1 Tax=Trichonephila clavipes TaxID=2585209 RepID=A0A8X6VSQ9_TRICX|nr:protein ALP1-like [Trichonephila clavipes]
MASDDQGILALGFAAICDIEMSKAKQRKIWQEKVTATENTIRMLREFNEGISSREDSESYRRFLRMDVSTFEELVAFVSPSIERKNTSMREAIPAAERIALTLRYLTTGETQSSLSYQFRIAQNTISDANLKFLYVDVGINGRVSDGGVWGKSKLRQAITNGDMNIPEAATLPGSASKLPFVIVADDAFPLMPNIMKPYPGSNLSKECLVFNYRLSRARRVSENAFGILAARFRVFDTAILTSVPNTKLIVLAACSLHNFLTNRSKNTYIPEDCAEREDILNGVLIEGNWRQNTNQLISCQMISSRGSNYAKDVRDRFCNFFNSEGDDVPWQDNNYTLH